MAFRGFGKIARLNRPIIVTEKIDGTNAQITILSEFEVDGHLAERNNAVAVRTSGGPDLYMFAGSRKRWVTPGKDNFGFAGWVHENADDLFTLGEGTHFGEWWGKGIQRGYSQPEKHFSLFNVSRWYDVNGLTGEKTLPPDCCNVVPILAEIPNLDRYRINAVINDLRIDGSRAAPGFMKPEGVMIYHVAGNVYFKQTIEKDEQSKWESQYTSPKPTQ